MRRPRRRPRRQLKRLYPDSPEGDSEPLDPEEAGEGGPTAPSSEADVLQAPLPGQPETAQPSGAHALGHAGTAAAAYQADQSLCLHCLHQRVCLLALQSSAGNDVFMIGEHD